jgi:hypothetical protein
VHAALAYLWGSLCCWAFVGQSSKPSSATLVGQAVHIESDSMHGAGCRACHATLSVGMLCLGWQRYLTNFGMLLGTMLSAYRSQCSAPTEFNQVGRAVHSWVLSAMRFNLCLVFQVQNSLSNHCHEGCTLRHCNVQLPIGNGCHEQLLHRTSLTDDLQDRHRIQVWVPQLVTSFQLVKPILALAANVVHMWTYGTSNAIHDLLQSHSPTPTTPILRKQAFKGSWGTLLLAAIRRTAAAAAHASRGRLAHPDEQNKPNKLG